MTITFPRAMPVSGPGDQVFEPARVDFETLEAGGRVNSVAAGLPRWRAEWTLAGVLTQAQSDAWRAFLASLDGSQRTFLGFEYGRELPRGYPQGFAGLARAGGGGFDGTATSWSQAISGDGQATVTLNGLPAGFALGDGDYVDFRWTTGGVARRSLARSLVAVTASGGGVAAFPVTPAVPALTPGDAVASLDHPACVMRLVTDQTKVTPMSRRRVIGASIVAVQDIRA